ncbi:MAG: hypothetical protein IJW86_05480 [Clostridia bacterium]|nr:hypothetical protein [Clostridia bacterium]
MFNSAKKTLSLITALIIIIMSLAPAAAAVQTYPEGIAKEQVSAAIPKLDTAIDSLIMSTQNKKMKELIMPEICSDKTLSALTTGIYKMIEENAESISSIGLDVTVSGVASKLGAYPEVQQKLSSYNKWSEVSLDGASWGVKDKEDFSHAAAAVFAPFNELLYMLLCGGTYKINSVIGLEGALGYETAIIPTLKALGCEKITDSSAFYRDAANDKNSMVAHIIDDVFAFLEGVLDSPCDRLTDVLPGIAYYFENGGFDTAVATLIEPLRLQIFNISTFIKVEMILSFIQDSESFTAAFDPNSLLSGTDIKMAELPLSELASCGTVNGDIVVSDKADTFLVLLRWLIETMKLNKDSLSGITGEDTPEEMTKIIDSLMSKGTDELVTLFISLLSQTQGKVLDYTWTFGEFTQTQVSYTPNLGADKYQRVVDGIDDLINEFIAEGGKNKTVREALAPQIYSNSLVTELAKGIYGIFESEDMKILGELMGISLTPAGLANELGGSFQSAKYTLSRSTKWSRISYINWGFKDGSKEGFKKAVCAVLSPLEDMLTMLLAEGKMTVLGSIDIYGSNGYNTAVIPLLEALGCSADKIETYEEFKKSAAKGKAIESLADAVLSLIERVLDRPVYTVTELLPNLLWFIENGGIEKAIENLMYPFTELLSQLGMSDMLDISSLMGELDMEQMMADMMGNVDLGMDLGDFDIKQFMTMGTLVTVQSKRTVNSQPATVSYIKADQPAIIVTLLRLIAEMMRTPGNEDMMMGFMGSGDNDMFSTFSGGIGEEMANMSVDETVEWLYKIFFRERATVEVKPESDYLPTIIYTPEKSGEEAVPILFGFLFIAAAEVIVILRRKKIMAYLEDRKIRKENNSQRNLQEV